MDKICTTIEQSKKLIELGIDINTADMCWEAIYVSPKDGIIEYADKPTIGYIKYCLPAWSLSALLDMWPTDTIYRPMLYKGVKNNLWHGNNNWFNNPLDAAFDIVSWLLENDKIGVKALRKEF